MRKLLSVMFVALLMAGWGVAWMKLYNLNGVAFNQESERDPFAFRMTG